MVYTVRKMLLLCSCVIVLMISHTQSQGKFSYFNQNAHPSIYRPFMSDKIAPIMRPGPRVHNNAVQGNHSLPLSCSVSISYFFPTAETVSVNGSSATGNCSSVTTFSSVRNGLSRCDVPTSSALFDGNIPTLTGLDGDMWASQLLTLQTTNGREIISVFMGTPEVGRVELVMLLNWQFLQLS